MAKGKKDYFGLGYLISLILVIIPPTAWILGALTRLQEGKIIAGLIRLIFGFTVIWVLDLISFVLYGKIFRFLNM